MNMMKRTALLLVLVLMLGLCACGNGGNETTTAPTEPGEKTYTVHTVDQNGDPVGSVILQFGIEFQSSTLAISGADGIASITTGANVQNVTVSSVPDGYTCDETTVSFDGSTDLTIVFTAEDNGGSTNVSYTITVVDQNGNGVPGVVVQLCDAESCKLPVSTDENGVAVCQCPESEYHVALNTIPEGYSSDVLEFYFDSGSRELTITITADGNGE